MLQAGIAQLPLGMAFRTTHLHLTRLAGVKDWVESQVFWSNTHNIRVGVRMAKVATLQLVQLVGARSVARSMTNQEAGTPPPQGFPHTMLNGKRVNDNMRLAFIEKFFYQP